MKRSLRGNLRGALRSSLRSKPLGYTGHRWVALDGTSDYLTVASDPFGGTLEYFTAAFVVKPTSFSAQQNLLWANASARLSIYATTGVVGGSFSGINHNSITSPTEAVVLNQTNVIQLAIRNAASAANSLMELWVNGVLSFSVGGAVSGGLTFGTYSAWALFATTAGASKFGVTTGGQASLAWLTAGATAAHYLPKSTYDFSNIRNLGADGSVGTGVVPRVFYGGQQIAGVSGDGVSWNAGKNQGSGPNFTMAGDGVA